MYFPYWQGKKKSVRSQFSNDAGSATCVLMLSLQIHSFFKLMLNVSSVHNFKDNVIQQNSKCTF